MSRGVPHSEFGRTRVLIAVALTVVLIALLVWDAIGPEYKVDPIVTGTLLGTIVSLVVVDVAALAGRRR